MGIKISKDHLHPSVIESITSLIGDLSQLETTAKGNAVEAINELLANGGNKEELEALIAEIAEGKELIANAVGEPLSSEDSFSKISNDINELLNSFKTNMDNAGVVIENEDKFKNLIDKIPLLVSNMSNSLYNVLVNKGLEIKENPSFEDLLEIVNGLSTIKYGSGEFNESLLGYSGENKRFTIPLTLNFTPSRLIICADTIKVYTYTESQLVTMDTSKQSEFTINHPYYSQYWFSATIENITSESFDIILYNNMSNPCGFPAGITWEAYEK